MLWHGHLGEKVRKGSYPCVNVDTVFVGRLVRLGSYLKLQIMLGEQ